MKWSNSWLETSSCNIFTHQIEEENGFITKFVVHQDCYENEQTKTNKLRVHKYVVAFYDKDMNIFKEYEITTKDDARTFSVDEIVGQKAAAAYHFNFKNYTYAKFVID